MICPNCKTLDTRKSFFIPKLRFCPKCQEYFDPENGIICNSEGA